MKQTTIAKLLAVAAAGLLSQAAFADGGAITFTGNIVDSPCSISPDSQNKLVPMGTVARTALDGAAGKRATPSKFTLLLQNCGATAKGATVTFTGTTDATVTDDLRIGVGEVAGAAATGVAIELGDSAGAKIPVGSASATYALAMGDNPLKFQATYVSTGPAVTVGTGNATAQFVVNYL
ncbi:fimbrial protein [Collimonas sp.]|uniref:fimbrial protein n=1 Tax=Collimonas sp. TaxID=1963772 RepID=UPI002C0CA9E4|nr:fimbrial protein [Collimonas sp.]HWW05420.1 fimbrial protein [Collimonas sp.]